SVAKPGPEFPFVHGFDGLLVESQPEAADYSNVAGATRAIHHQLQNHGSRILRLASFFGIFRIDLIKDLRGRYTAAYAEHATAYAAALARSISAALTWA